jgi:hypothetical protein
MKTFLFSVSLFLSFSCCGQEEQNARFVRAGILSGGASISPGLLLQQNISTISIPLTGEYYLDEHVSIKADVFIHVSSGLTADSLRLIANHQLFTGLSYHFKTTGNLDPYLCFQPGLAYSQVKRESKLPFNDQTPNGTIEYTPSVNPILGVAAGINYFFPRFFHIFIEARYVHGNALFNAPWAFPLDELKVQFGLGWNMNVFGTNGRTAKLKG